MPIILSVCLVIVVTVIVVLAVFIIRLLLRLEKTADEISQSSRAFRDSLSEANLGLRELRQAVASFAEVAAPIRQAAERFGRLGDRAAGITSTLLDEVAEPLMKAVGLWRGIRAAAGYFLARFSRREQDTQ